MTKPAIRKTYNERRLRLTENEKMKLDDLLLIQFQRLPLQHVQVVFSFYPMEERGEINTLLFTRFLHHIIPGVTICYPVIDPASNYMQAIAANDETSFEINKFGITEPAQGRKIEPEEIDLAIVPLFAFDVKGNRVGYGKGYYDRFLKQCQPDAILAGVSYFPPVDIIEDTDEFDVPLNYCITPEKLYEF